MESFQFETSFGRALGMAHTAMFRHLAKLMKEKNLPITPEQFSVLTHLWRNDGLPQSELAVCTNRNRANVTRIIDILEREGIVVRKDDPNDRRVFRIYLTDLGKKLKNEAAKCAQKSIEDSLDGVSENDRTVALSVFKKIVDNVT
ncbi:MarR family transcriptional regulator [Runella rosea]|uniref:MarR family transcriptional regulator n=1 Tax=Runella rosea TaxID=2259595 RepID=A0A344TIJ9_9BACT|nr:MarR family transcriptional regulator [Runella rosea]AXE18470.1 MarR family transcriptional regulator [Runella rosea]